jgi:hypothetical protein
MAPLATSMIGACLRIVDQIGTQVEIADFAPRRLASGKFGQAGMPGQGRQGKLNPMLGASQHCCGFNNSFGSHETLDYLDAMIR